MGTNGGGGGVNVSRLEWGAGTALACQPKGKTVTFSHAGCQVCYMWYEEGWKDQLLRLWCLLFFNDNKHLVNFLGWCQWEPFGMCSTTCGPGIQDWTRRCECPPPGPGGMQCPGMPTKTEECKNLPCGGCWICQSLICTTKSWALLVPIEACVWANI